ncbi:MAG: insulinase family protein [Pseudomonadota bacterium]
MKLPAWATLALSLLVAPLALSAPVIAQEKPAEEQSSVPEPKALQSVDETPWLYLGSNVPVDREWLFGEMDNGLRYAVRRNGVPPGQVSIRVRIDAGSLHERDFERGYAHLLEHLLFRESKYLGQAEAIAAWQRLGATFGSDTNAETSPTHTAYKLDVPNIDDAKLTESFKYLSGMIREPVLNDANVAAELPIVLAEKRERGGAQQRVADLWRSTQFAGQRMATRTPIGTVETLEAATGERVSEFHRRWYRPENAVVVVVGDADPMMLAGLVEQWFGDWEGQGEAAIAPEFGDPVAPDNAVIAEGTGLAIGEAAATFEADYSRVISYSIMRPWRPVNDTITYNEGLILDRLAQTIINRRLETRARAGGSFLSASVGQADIYRSTDATIVSVSPLTDDWEAALADVRAVIKDALSKPPTQAEIDREAAGFTVGYDNLVEQERVQAASSLADMVVNAVDIRETVASPRVARDVFLGMGDRLNPEEVFARTKALFEGDVVRSLYVTPEPSEADAEALKLALAREVEVDSSARLAENDIDFDDLPAIGTPGEVVSQKPLGILEVEQVNLSNGVRALLWSNDAEPGRVTVRVRFGSGYRAFDADNAVYATLGQGALVSSGFGDLGRNEIDSLATGRKLGFDFGISDAVFIFSAQTRSVDVEDQLYIFAAKLAMPRWDADPVVRTKAALELNYKSYSTSPGAIFSRDFEYLVTDNDPRFAVPDPEALAKVTPDGFREVWAPLLKQGPIEVLVFGEFDKDAVIAKLTETFGALPTREPIPAAVAARVPGFPAAEPLPTVLRHRGDPNQAAAVIAWKSGGGIRSLRESRQIKILTEIFNNRLRDALREDAGAAYSPQVTSRWPKDIGSGGTITAIAQIEPEFLPLFFSEADRIARDLAANPPTEDEIKLATEPLGEVIRRNSTGNLFWLYQLEGASYDPRRIALIPSLLSDSSRTTPKIMRFLAERYFAEGAPFRVAIIPEGQELAEVAPVAPPKPKSAPATIGSVQGPEVTGR